MIKISREYGGYLSLEINEKQEYYYGENVIRFNCARSAMEYVLIENDFDTIYVPAYMCESVRNTVKKNDIKINYYNIDGEFKPQVDKIESSAVIVVTNYYGIRSNQVDLVKKYKNVIYDNTQAFFQPPIDGAFNIYSCRKFFGVCDGAYLISNMVDCKRRKEYIPQYADYLYNAINKSTNAAYETSLKNEEQLEHSGMCDMSKMTKKIMETIDYKNVKKRRYNNYKTLQDRLGKINCFDDTLEDDMIPMVYPLLVEDESLRGKLVSNKIYVPQWWKYILDEDLCNNFEKKLSRYLLPLPIDQRYSEDDMIELFNLVKALL